MDLDEFQIPDEAFEKLSDPENLKRHLDEGKTFQEIIGYSNETMEKFYGAAYQLFQKGEYEKCADAFVFLTTLNPYVHSYWLGLGMAEQLQHKFESALNAYSMASLTDFDDPVSHYHAANCYYEQKDIANAIASLELSISHAGEKEQFQTVKEQAIRTRQRILRE